MTGRIFGEKTKPVVAEGNIIRRDKLVTVRRFRDGKECLQSVLITKFNRIRSCFKCCLATTVD